VLGARVVVRDFMALLYGYGGYHPSGADWVAISQGKGEGQAAVDSLAKNIRLYVGHEFLHMQTARLTSLAKQEAYTEHLNLALRPGGNVDVMQPDERAGQGLAEHYVYTEERNLEHVLLRMGGIALSPRAGTYAFTAPPQSGELEKFDRLLDESWEIPYVRQWLDLPGVQKELRDQNVRAAQAGRAPLKNDLQIQREAARQAQQRLLWHSAQLKQKRRSMHFVPGAA
jgi:hypothetical protein